jgi:DNA-binding IclR family transcriptional regulator
MPTAAAETPARELLQRIRGEYLEMPGLRLTAEQAQRLWSLDLTTCTSLLEALVEAKFLSRSRDGQYFRLSYA